MPISFEPAQPLDVNVASAYGANQSFQQALPAIASLYEAGGRLQQQGQIAEADRQTHAQQESARLRQHADLFKYAQDQQVQRDLFESTRGFEMQQQKAELASWLNQQELSQKEQLRLQAMTAGVSDVLQNPDLSDSERVNLVTKLKTGIDVYKQRQEKALAKQEEAHAQAYTDQAARQTKIANANAAMSSQTLEQRVNTIFDEGELQRIRDANPGADEQAVRAEALRRGAYSQVLHNGVDQYGNIKDHVLDGHGRSHAAKKGADAEGGLTEEQYLKHRLEVIKSVDAWAAKRDAEAAKAGQSVLTPEERKTNYADAMKAAGMGQSYTEHRAMKGGRRGDDIGSGDVPAPKDVPPEIIERAKTQGESALKAILDAPNLPPAVKDQAQLATATLQRAVENYGTADPQKVPAAARVEVQAATNLLMAAGHQLARPAPPPGPQRSYAPPWIGGRFDGGKQ